MKAKIAISIAALITCAATAMILSPFQSWNAVEKYSSDIVIVRCVRLGTREPLYYFGPGNFNATIKVVAVLKGATNVTSALLWTDHPLQQDENYLVFGDYKSGIPRTKIKIGRTNHLSEEQLREMLPRHYVREGEWYMAVGAHETGQESGVYEAIEEYRVVPLGREREAGTIEKTIAGKSLNEQIQILFKRAANYLNGKIHNSEKERERLEQEIKK